MMGPTSTAMRQTVVTRLKMPSISGSREAGSKASMSSLMESISRAASVAAVGSRIWVGSVLIYFSSRNLLISRMKLPAS